MWEWVANWTESQTAVVTTFMLILGGAVGVWLGSVAYGGKVKDLQSAVAETERKVKEHMQTMDSAVSELNQNLEEMFLQMRSGIADIRDATEAAEDELRVDFKNNWYSVRDNLQKAAAVDWIHGKTKKRYQRFSNNEIDLLIEAMVRDDNLFGDRLSAYRDAFELWRYHRNGKPQLTEHDVQKMKEYALRTIEDYE